MKKSLYLLSIGFALCIMVYFYLINFDNMSETELVNAVLYWYMPLIFGLYGYTSHRITLTIDDDNSNAIAHLFSGKDVGLIILSILLMALGGVIGILLFFLPLLIFKPKTDNFDIKVAIIGTIIWLVLLFVFFEVLWPSL